MASEGTRSRALLVNVLVVAVCALVYELLCGTLASYLLGDAVLQFSLVLGTYLFAMGAGAWASKWLEARASARYVQTELLLALVGGLSVPGLLLAVSAHVPLRPALYAVVFMVGALVGTELPLLIKILRTSSNIDQPIKADQHIDNRSMVDSSTSGAATPEAPSFAGTLARALAYDYVGALAASVLFPLVLVPRLGLVRTSVAFGIVNAIVAVSATYFVKMDRRSLVWTLRAAGAAVLGCLAVAFVRGEAWVATVTD